jgi:hypothetical protein
VGVELRREVLGAREVAQPEGVWIEGRGGVEGREGGGFDGGREGWAGREARGAAARRGRAGPACAGSPPAHSSPGRPPQPPTTALAATRRPSCSTTPLARPPSVSISATPTPVVMFAPAWIAAVASRCVTVPMPGGGGRSDGRGWRRRGWGKAGGPAVARQQAGSSSGKRQRRRQPSDRPWFRPRGPLTALDHHPGAVRPRQPALRGQAQPMRGGGSAGAAVDGPSDQPASFQRRRCLGPSSLRGRP